MDREEIIIPQEEENPKETPPSVQNEPMGHNILVQIHPEARPESSTNTIGSVTLSREKEHTEEISENSNEEP